MCDYEEITHIPMVICHPDLQPGRLDALTWTPDLAPTLVDLHGAEPLKHAHGKSWLPLFKGEVQKNHDHILTGYFGKDVSITDGKTTYIRQPIQGAPCYHHTLMPRGFQNFLPENELKNASYGDWLSYTEGLPMLRIPRKSHRHRDAPDHHILYDLVNDPKQNHPIYDAEQQKSWVTTLDQALKNVQAPEWQWDRLDMQKA
jgi:arylsulfatase A-like enzyme